MAINLLCIIGQGSRERGAVRQLVRDLQERLTHHSQELSLATLTTQLVRMHFRVSDFMVPGFRV